MRLLTKSVLLAAAAAFTFSMTASAATFSEFRLDQSGSDASEYIELFGTPGESLDGLHIIIIGDGTGAGAGGAVEAIIDLTGSSIPADGYFLIAETTFGTGGLGLTGSVDLTTNVNFENSDNLTLLLVTALNDSIHVGSGFGGSDLDVDDDNVIDASGDYGGDGGDDGAPFGSIVDELGIVETVGSGDLVYSSTTVGPDGSFVPANAFLCSTGWQIGAFGGGDDTPGVANNCPVPVQNKSWGEIKKGL